MGVITRVVSAVMCIVFGVIAVAWYLQDRALRRPADAFSDTFHLAQRRPAHAETIRLAPAADLAFEIAGDVAVQDALGSVRVSELDDETRELWLRDIARVEEELEAAQGMLLEGVTRRPGWAYHQSLLGMVDSIRTEGREGSRWLEVLNGARSLAPGDLALTRFTGSAVLSSWSFLSENERAAASSIFATALQDPEFVSASFGALIHNLGESEASGLLPESAPALAAAVRVRAATGDARATAPLYARWERAEMLARQADLRAINRMRGVSDLAELRGACVEWVNRHPIHAFDSPEGRSQVAELLALWPGIPGRWTTDPRAELIRYFMNGRMRDVSPEVLQSAASALRGIPAPTAARISLAAGDFYSAESLANSSQASGSLEWTPFFVDLSRYHLREGDVRRAEAVLERVAPAALDECDVAVARVVVSEAAFTAVEMNPGVFLRNYPASLWAAAGVPICIEPGSGSRDLLVQFEIADRPALLGAGFDGGRSRTYLLGQGTRQIRLPLNGRSGRHFFSYEVIAGGQVAPLSARLE